MINKVKIFLDLKIYIFSLNFGKKKLLKNLKNILLGLQTEFTEGGSKVIFAGDKKDDFNKGLLLL